jgi:hypothetical protein
MKQVIVDTDLYWTLPGPRRFISRVAGYAVRSRILCINLPLDLMPGTWEGVKKGLTDAHVTNVIDLTIRSGTDIAADIGVHFDLNRVTAEQLAGMKAEQPTAVILRSIGEEARSNCEHYAHEFMSVISSVQGNIHLVIGFNKDGLREDMHDNGIQVLVFDGGLTYDEMDAYVALRMLDDMGPGSTRLTRKIVSEFAGHDVDFAERLMMLDEFQIVNIIDHLGTLMGEELERWRSYSWLKRTESLSSPKLPHVLHDRYLADHAGSPEAKDVAKKRIDQRYWRACVKAMTPWLEERRMRVIGYFHDQLQEIANQYSGKIPRPQGERTIYADPEELEYNNIVGMAYKNYLTPKTQKQRDALTICKTAKAIRDDIAHLRKPNPEDIMEIIRQMDKLLPNV